MTEQYSFQAEIQEVLNILIYSLYQDREIFLRELISNASDALNRVQFEMLTTRGMRDADQPLEVTIMVDEEANTLTVSDTGIGMTAEEMVDSLGVIARSGAKAFIEKVRGSEGDISDDIIGQFGVGFYSVFMVADRVEVISLSHDPDAAAARWESDGQEGYTISDAEKATRGTDIIVHLREDATEFATPWRVQQAIRRHSQFVSFPIYVEKADAEEEEDGERQPVNETQAIWRRSSDDIEEEEYNQFYRSLTMDFEPPLEIIHTYNDAPFQFYALLYIPSQAEGSILSTRTEPGLKLYTRKVLIQEYMTDLLPEYLKFVQGVVDSEDLPLNVSRETIQDHPLVPKLKSALTREVLTELRRLSKRDEDTYTDFWDEFGVYLKQGIITEPGDRKRIEPLLRFASDQSEGELISLRDYVDNFAKMQEDIYYIMADTEAAAARSPHLDAFRARGIDVLYMTDTVDGFMVPGLGEFDGHSFVAVDAADLDLEGVGTKPDTEDETEPVEAEDMADLIIRMREVLGERVEDVRESKVLAGSTAARLVAPQGTLDRHQQRLYQMLEQEYEVPKYILEINPRHPIVANITARLQEGEDVAKSVDILYQNAMLAEGIHPDPSALAKTIQDLLEAATRS